MIEKIASFLKSNIVLVIASLAAIYTMFYVKPSRDYLAYFDFKTLGCLFMVLAVICAFKNIDFFYILADKVIVTFKNSRACVFALVYISFLFSMFIGNDMALISFLPLSYFVLHATHQDRYIAFTFIMQSIAANLGGMVTPFGNPQNLYLYTFFNIPVREFVMIMLPPFAVSLLLITVCCLFVKKERLELEGMGRPLRLKRTIVYTLLFILAIGVILRLVPCIEGLLIIVIVLVVFDFRALLEIDYPLLLTFVAFFIFAGNISRIPEVNEFVSYWLSQNPLLVSIGTSQVISNVPSAILLSQFTESYRELLLGVNIGGVGTLVGSLASLITLRQYMQFEPGKTGHFIWLFTAFNFGFLIVLTIFELFIIY